MIQTDLSAVFWVRIPFFETPVFSVKELSMERPCKKQTLIMFILLALSFFTACHPPLVKEAEGPEQALVPVRWFYPSFEDDMDLDSLREAVERNLQYLTRQSPEREYVYGPDRYTCRQVMESQAAFLEMFRTASSPK